MSEYDEGTFVPLTQAIAERIAITVNEERALRITADEVWDVYRSGAVQPSTIGEDFDASLTDSILDELDACGISSGPLPNPWLAQ